MARQPRQLQVNCTFPFRGLNTVSPYEQQPELTTPSLQNVRAFDMTTGRKRGGQRPGLSKFNSSQASAYHIQDMIQVRTTAAGGGTGSLVLRNSDDMKVYSYNMDGTAGVEILDLSGIATEYLTAATFSDGAFYGSISRTATPWDHRLVKLSTEGGAIFDVAFTPTTASYWFSYGIAVMDGVVYVLVNRLTTPYTAEIWRFDSDTGSNMDSGVPWKSTGSGLTNYAMLSKSGSPLLAASDNRIAVVTNAVQSSTVTQSVVEIIRSSGIALTAITTCESSYTKTTDYRPGIITDGIGNFYHWTSEDAAGAASAKTNKVYKIDASNGSVASGWPIDDDGQTYSGTDADIQSLSYDWVTDRLFATGFNVRDTGKSFAVLSTSDGAATSEEDLFGLTDLQICLHDGEGGVTCVRNATGDNVIAASVNLSYSTGTIFYDHVGGTYPREVVLTTGTYPSWAADGFIEISGTYYEVSTREDGTHITLTAASNPGVDAGPGLSYVLTETVWAPKDVGHNTQYSAAIDARPPSANEVGAVVLLSVSNGTVKKFTTDGFEAPTGGGAGSALNSSSNQIFSVPFQGVAYYTDGLSYKKYTSSTDTVATWAADNGGTLPQDSDSGLQKPTLIETWANRILLAGLSDDKTNVFASKIGDPLDFDYAPATPTVADAFALSNVTSLGKMSDIVNAIIPYNNDVCLFGGDHSIRMLSGNPLEGGRLDVVTEITGIVYGRAWCYGPGGRVFFMGSQGGVYMLVPSASYEPASLTDQSIEEDLRTTNFSTTVVTMVWDDRQHGLCIYLTPTDGTAGTHYFWDSRSKAWFRDVIPAAQQPYCVMVHDADDPDDRVVLIGGQAGYIRKIDYAADDDDGTAIDSYVFIPIWPVGNRNRGEMMQLTELRAILGSDSDDVTATIHRGQTVYDALTASAFITQTFSAGRNHNRRENCTAHAMWLKLANNTNNESWQIEVIEAMISETSRARSRAFT